MTKEYMEKEMEFMNAKGALCENEKPQNCDCGKCPLRALCQWLEGNDPYKK